MARVKAIAVGYYNHRRVKVGTIFNMNGVDAEGYYVDAKGKRLKFKDPRNKDAPEIEKKCLWVGSVSSKVEAEVDPKEVAKVLSGKLAGVPEVPGLDDPEEVSSVAPKAK